MRQHLKLPTKSSIQILTFALTFILSNSISAQSKENLVAFAFSGGGSKGIAQIGCLKVLEREGIRPDLISGTSIGSILGGLYSIGYSIEDLEKLAEKQEELAEKTENRDEPQEELKKEQEEIEKEFEKLEKELEDIEKKNEMKLKDTENRNNLNPLCMYMCCLFLFNVDITAFYFFYFIVFYSFFLRYL